LRGRHSAESYSREVNRLQDQVPSDVTELLGRLRDPEFTSILLVTIPEPTPVHEAMALQEDLGRAGIRPAAWIVNQSLSASGTDDPVLVARAFHEIRWLKEVLSYHPHVALVSWQPTSPAGPDSLASLVDSDRQAAVLIH
jgi:arsenite-transporting ATPase